MIFSSGRVLFIMPSRYKAPDKLRRAVEFLSKQITPLDHFYIIINTDDPNFHRERYPDNVQKIVFTDPTPSIPRSLNALWDDLHRYKYFCFIHDDIRIHDEDWIERCIRVCSIPECGEVGVVCHSSTTSVPVAPGVSSIEWADGIYFMKTETMLVNGKFDERFTQDCAEQDFAYRLRSGGKTNYIMDFQFTHEQTAFRDKAPMDEVKRCRRLFRSMWG